LRGAMLFMGGDHTSTLRGGQRVPPQGGAGDPVLVSVSVSVLGLVSVLVSVSVLGFRGAVP
jgi:hypothetical protein